MLQRLSAPQFGGGRLGTDGGNILLTNESGSVSALVWRKKDKWYDSNGSKTKATRPSMGPL